MEKNQTPITTIISLTPGNVASEVNVTSEVEFTL